MNDNKTELIKFFVSLLKFLMLDCFVIWFFGGALFIFLKWRWTFYPEEVDNRPFEEKLEDEIKEIEDAALDCVKTQEDAEGNAFILMAIICTLFVVQKGYFFIPGDPFSEQSITIWFY